MRSILFTFAVWFSSSLPGFGEPVPEGGKALPEAAVRLKKAYEQKVANAVRPIRAAYEKSAAAAIQPATEEYLGELRKAMDAAAKAADFDAAAAIKKEIEAVTLAATAPLDGHYAIPPTVVFKALVDATDDIIIQDGKLRVQHIDWSKPLNLSVNDQKWEPKWKLNDTDAFTGFVPALPTLVDAYPSMRLAKGKGEAFIRERPTKENGYKLVVRVIDAGIGASEFEVHLTW